MNLTLGVDFEAVSVKSITSYREFDIFLFNDLDFSPHIVFGNTHPEYSQEQFSQELQLTGTGLDSRLNYVVGAYYFKEDGVEDIFNQIAHVPAISAGPPTNFSRTWRATSTTKAGRCTASSPSTSPTRCT